MFVPLKLKNLIPSLTRWNKFELGGRQIRIEMLKAKMYQLGSQHQHPPNSESWHNYQMEFDMLLWDKEVMWAQNCWINWMQSGDKKHKIFPLVSTYPSTKEYNHKNL